MIWERRYEWNHRNVKLKFDKAKKKKIGGKGIKEKIQQRENSYRDDWY